MQFSCEDFATEWIEFKGVIDPEQVEIPIASELLELGKAHLAVGWTYNHEENRPVSSLFDKKPIRKDAPF